VFVWFVVPVEGELLLPLLLFVEDCFDDDDDDDEGFSDRYRRE